MKSVSALLLTAILVSLLTVPAHASEAPAVSAAAYVLMDAASGRVLAGENEDEPRLIASTTKIMTALLALERLDPSQAVEIVPAWTGIEGSSMYLEPGQELTVEDLLYGLMLASGNDAAVALACLAAGSVEDFAALMNEKAAALGCENTHFENPNGLDGVDHHASARDLARITREAIRNEDFVRIASTVSAQVGELTFTNHNRLLRECEGVFGVKTGYTEAAGRTLVTCCERDGITLICVTLSDPDDWTDHKTLYDWAYDAYVRDDAAGGGTWTLPVIGGEMEAVPILPAEELSVLHREGETVLLSVKLPRFVYASVACGNVAGTASVYVNGYLTASVPLLYGASVERMTEAAPTLGERLARLAERKIYTFS